MYIVITRNIVKNDGIDDYIKVSKKFAEDVKKEKGCIDSIVCIDDEKSNCVVNIETWQNKEAFERYDGSAFLRYKSELKKNFISNTSLTFATV